MLIAAALYFLRQLGFTCTDCDLAQK